jgi:hypothetical protein
LPYDFDFGSQAAKGGFANEEKICEKFMDWKRDNEAKKWLMIMGYEIDKIDTLEALQIPVRITRDHLAVYGLDESEYENLKFKKADIQVQIRLFISFNGTLRVENLSLKKANEGADYNQVDKRSVDSYQEMWKFNNQIAEVLKIFSGENPPLSYCQYLKPNIILRDKRRAFFDEIKIEYVEEVVAFFEKNRMLVVADVLKGRGGLSADWILVTKYDPRNDTTLWILKDINVAMNFFGGGDIHLSPNGSLSIGRITMQRKGGTPDPTKLQFKIKPSQLIEA